jgi:amino acid transporter
VALVACTLLGVFFFFPAPSWYLFVGIVSIALTLSYVMGGPVLAVLRRTAPDFPRPVKLPAATFWAIAGYVASILRIYFAGWVPLINLFTAVFFALPLYGAYTSVRNGWSRSVPSWLLSAAFTIAWVITAVGGGWLFTIDQEQREGSWGFPVYFTAIVLIVVVFIAGLYAVSSDVGRRHIRGGTWMVATFLVLLLVAYIGQFGPMESPLLDNPIDLLVMIVISIATFLWSVRVGGPTEELAEILAAQEERSRAAAI